MFNTLSKNATEKPAEIGENRNGRTEVEPIRRGSDLRNKQKSSQIEEAVDLCL